METRMQDYDIKFSGLKLGLHQFAFEIGNAFFQLMEYEGFEDVRIEVATDLTKKANSLELQFKIEGEAYVYCDLTNEPFWLPLSNEAGLVVKFGEKFDDTNEEVLVLPQGAFKLNVAQYIYELSVLAMPLKKVHPEVEKGERGQEMLAKLKEYSPEYNDEKEEIDPRWAELKKLKNKN